MNKYLILMLGSLLMFNSCGLFSNYQRQDGSQVPQSLYRDTANTAQVLLSDTTNFGNRPWREVFTDPLLQALIEKALTNNSDMQQADLSIRQAQDGLRVSRLAFFPQISLGATGTVSSWDFKKAAQIYNVPLQAGWQIDAFGTLRNAKKQSEVTLEQAKIGKQATQTAIIAAVANLYYTLEMLDEQLSTTRATGEIWNKNVQAMELMKEAGYTTSAAVSQSKANYLSLLGSIPQLQASIASAENSLCALLHESPHAIERGVLGDASFPSEFSVGVPLQLLSNRPDVRIAELQMAYAFYGVQGARGAFYPQISLSGSGAWTNSSGMGIVNPGKILASAVGSLVQPLFAQGKLRANLDIAKAQQESAQIRFEQALLDAGNEVSSALADYHAISQRIELDKQLVGELTNTAEVTEFIFRNDNTVSYLETLSAQQALLQARLGLISDRFDLLQAGITLYQALGGGRN
ncbi:MAG: efflux transporter outer membrane subunit [Alloprevotella sp.]|nr:efflux transporter outer membrane subunit [Alloprevotella sp.]